MTYLISTGLTNATINGEIKATIISRRAANFLIRQTLRGKWERPVFKYSIAIPVLGKYLMVGFQPDTNRHLVIRHNTL